MGPERRLDETRSGDGTVRGELTVPTEQGTGTDRGCSCEPPSQAPSQVVATWQARGT